MFTFYPISKDFDSVLESLTSDAYKSAPTYPPYNIFEEEQGGVIEMAVTGLSEKDIQIYFDEDNYLVIEGKYPDTSEKMYKHKGLSKKDFTRKFRLEKNYNVQSAEVKDGLLRIALHREDPKRQLIPINTQNALDAPAEETAKSA